MAERAMPEYQEMQTTLAAPTSAENMRAKLELGPIAEEWKTWLFPEDGDG